MRRTEIRNEIERLAKEFRKGIEKAYFDMKFTDYPFCHFPKDCCDDASILLGQYLINNGYKCKLVRGNYYEDYYENNQKYLVRYNHIWIIIDEIYVDITADQFINDKSFISVSDYLYPCYVGFSNKFYDSFDSIKTEEFTGINNYNYFERNRLKKLYNTICSYI